MRLTEDQTRLFKDQSQIVIFTKYLAEMASKNTILIPKGQVFAKQMTALAGIVERQRHSYIAAIFETMGIKQATVNPETGELKDIVMKV